MSNELTGAVGFQNQIASSKGMRAALWSALGDGVVDGFTVTYGGGLSVGVSAGYISVRGGIAYNPSAITVQLSGSSGYARIIANVDLSKTATTSEFKQVFLSADYSATLAGFSSLTQQDVNISGQIYQFEVAVVSIGTAGLVRSCCAAGSPSKPVKLWSGTWSSGGITVNGLSDYAIIGVESEGKIALCNINDGSGAVSAGGYYRSGAGSDLAWIFRFNRSGDSLSSLYCKWRDPYDNSTGDRVVTAIYGIYKLSEVLS